MEARRQYKTITRERFPHIQDDVPAGSIALRLLNSEF
jgi:hypothetical protein